MKHRREKRTERMRDFAVAFGLALAFNLGAGALALVAFVLIRLVKWGLL